MAVFTEVGFDSADALVQRLGLGTLRELRGIEAGIENTNYFATTDRGEYVLTVFERLGHEQLPYYLCLMKHLAERGIPVPAPAADPTVATGTARTIAAPAKGQALKAPSIAPCDLLHTLSGKPAAVVQRLSGKSELAPTAAHCAELGRMLARMHLAGRDFDRLQPNLRGLAWWNDTAPVVLPYLDSPQAALLRSELAYQNHVAESSGYAALPRGPVHADLFRDNAMFATDTDGCVDADADADADGDGQGAPCLTGIFDFYFAGTDTWLFDLAVCLNDWAIDLATGEHHAARADALLAAYGTVRPLTGAERALLPALLRAAALRFWISRLWDYHLPREASMLKPHDPTHFERVLRQRARHPDALHAATSAADPNPAAVLATADAIAAIA